MSPSLFVPRFDDIGRIEGHTIQCVWNVNPKKGEPQRQCTRIITVNIKNIDVNDLLQKLKDENSCSTKFQNDIETLAQLHLCGRSHRNKFFGSIANQWKKQIEDRRAPRRAPREAQSEPARQGSQTTTSTVHNSTATHETDQGSIRRREPQRAESAPPAVTTTSKPKAGPANALKSFVPALETSTSSSLATLESSVPPPLSTPIPTTPKSGHATSSNPDGVSTKHTTVKPLTWRGSPSTVRKLLRIDEDEEIKCHAMRAKGGRCGQRISIANRQRITSIVNDLSRLSSVGEQVTELLLILSTLAMCRAYHQSKADAKYREWMKLLDVLVRTEPGPESSARTELMTPLTTAVSRRPMISGIEMTTQDGTPYSVVPEIWSPTTSNGNFTPDTTPPSRSRVRPYQPDSSPTRRRSTATENSSILDNAHSHTSPIGRQIEPTNRRLFSPPSANTRSSASLFESSASPAPPISVFVPYDKKSCSQLTALEKLRTCLEVPRLHPREETGGYIYIFQRTPNGIYKVGKAINVESRMSGIQSSCHYPPNVLFRIHVPHVYKVERLIQCDLHLQRRKEDISHYKTCNEGKGCATTHGEWFEIELKQLIERIGVWVDLIRSEPYNAEFRLKNSWALAVKLIRFGHEVWDWRKWVDAVIASSKTIVTAKTEPEREESDIKRSVIKVEADIEVSEIAKDDIKVEISSELPLIVIKAEPDPDPFNT